MEWAIPPRPHDRLMPSVQLRKDSLASASYARLTWNPYRPAEGFQNFQLTTISEDSTTILPLQSQVQRFIEQIYVPSGTFMKSENELPYIVKTILNYYRKYLKERTPNTYDPIKQWSLKYTGETKDLESLKPTTPWDLSYKYYRWNFANPTECSIDPRLKKSIPDFEFAFHELETPIIYTYAKAVEAFQISQINTGKRRIELANQKYKNGVLMIRFEKPVQFDGYIWAKDANLNPPPESGWVLQGSNDDSVWNEEVDASTYRDNLQLDSPKWQTLHIVTKGSLDPLMAELIAKQNLPNAEQTSSTIKRITNMSRISMRNHMKAATLAMVSLYITQTRQIYVKLPASMQSKITDCYTDVERDLSDSKNSELNERRVEDLVEKYIFNSTGVDVIRTLEDVDISADLTAAKNAPNDTSKLATVRVPTDLPLVPGMFVRVKKEETPAIEFNANIYSYARTAQQGMDAGSLTLFRMRNFPPDATFSGKSSFTIQAFFYNTQTKAPTARTSSSVTISPNVGSSITFTVPTGLVYPSSSVPVRVYSLQDEFVGFVGNVANGGYSSGSLTVSNIAAATDLTFPSAVNATWVIRPTADHVASQILTPIAESTLSFYVDSGLSYTSNNSVRVTNKSGNQTFEATVGNYNAITGFLELRNIRNIVGNFRTAEVYTVIPLQNACIVRLRDQMRMDVRSNMDKIYTFVNKCESKSENKEGETVEVTKGANSTTVVFRKRDPDTKASEEIAKYILSPGEDKNALDKDGDNLDTVISIYNKYNDAFNNLVKTNVMQKQIPEPNLKVDSAENLGLFEEPGEINAVSAMPDIVLRQIKRMINEKMKYFYNMYYFNETAATETRGSTYTRKVLTPVKFTKYYEPTLRDLFKLDPTTGKSQITLDYEYLWDLTFKKKETDAEGNDIFGKEILVAMNKKYDNMIESLKRNKEIAEERMKTIQRMEVFEDFYFQLSSVLTTMVMQLPEKAVRDNERLFIAPNSNNVEELIALRNKYIDYTYTNKIMRNYVEVPNDLWTCARKAITDLSGTFLQLYETEDPTPEGQTVRLSEWKRSETNSQGVVSNVEKTHFQELEESYSSLDVQNRPTVVYAEIKKGDLNISINNIFSFVTDPSNDVFKKPEAGDSNTVATKTNLDNYNAVTDKIQTIQNEFVRLYNAKEVLDPTKEANKPLGLLTRTRSAIQIDKLKVRVRRVVQYYKRLYEAYVDVSGVNGNRWSDLYTQPIVLNDTDNTIKYEYIVNVYKVETVNKKLTKYVDGAITNNLWEKYNIHPSEIAEILEAFTMPSASYMNPVTNSLVQTNTSISVLSTAEMQTLVDSNIGYCVCGWVKSPDNSYVNQYPSNSESINICGNGAMSVITCDQNWVPSTSPSGTADKLASLYLKVTTNELFAFLNKLRTVDIKGWKYNCDIISQNIEQKFNTYKITKPVTTLQTTYSVDLQTITGFLTDVRNTNTVQQQLLEMEKQYVGYMNVMIEYVKNVGMQLHNKFLSMKTDYTGKVIIPDLNDRSSELSGLSFSINNDSIRAASFSKLNTLLNISASQPFRDVYSNPTIVSEYMKQYTLLLQRVFAYESKLEYYKMQAMSAKRKYSLLYSALVPTTGIKLIAPTDNRNSTFNVDTPAVASESLNSAIRWINTDLYSAAKTAMETFFRNTSAAYNAHKDEPYYADMTSADKTALSTIPATPITISSQLAKIDNNYLTMRNLGMFNTSANNIIRDFTSFMQTCNACYMTLKNLKTIVDREEVWLIYGSRSFSGRYRNGQFTAMSLPADATGVATNTDIAVDPTGTYARYKKLDYVLVGGGGGGGGADYGWPSRVFAYFGGGGGGSGYFKNSIGYDDVPDYIRTQIGLNTSAENYKKLVKGSFANSAETYNISGANTITRTNEVIKIKIGSGGSAAPHEQRDGGSGNMSILYLNDISNVIVAGGGGGKGGTSTFDSKMNPAPKGGAGPNNGGDGVGGGLIDANNANTINVWHHSSGAGGDGIGFGQGALGSTTREPTPTGFTSSDDNRIWRQNARGGRGAFFFTRTLSRINQATAYSGAGGGGGIKRSLDYNEIYTLQADASAGAAGYAILRLWGVDSTFTVDDTIKTLGTFLDGYTYVAPVAGFQNQNPYNPQKVEQKIISQKLNAIQFTTAQKPATILGFLSWLWT